MNAYLKDLALSGAALYPSTNAEEPIRGTALETLVGEYLQANAVISRLGGAIDRAVLLAIAAGVELSLENTFAAQQSAERLEKRCGTRMSKLKLIGMKMKKNMF